MCQQCTTEATAFKKRPFKGWFLVKATKDDVYKDNETGEESGPVAGCWGIGVCNAPYFWFDGNPAPDPAFGMTDEQMEEYYKDMTPEKEKADKLFDEFREKVEDNLDGPAIYGYLLGKACAESGWDYEAGGLASFVAHRVWLASQSEQWPHDMPADLNPDGSVIPAEHED